MKSLAIFIILIVELTIPVALLWKNIELYKLGWFELYVVCQLFLLMLAVILAHWLHLKRKHYPQNVCLKLFFLTGPSIFLCFTLICGLTNELNKLRIRGYNPKEITIKLAEKEEYPLVQKKNNFETRLINSKFPISDVVNYLGYERMKSELLIYIILLLSCCILYKTRSSSSCSQAIERIKPEKEIDKIHTQNSSGNDPP